MNKYVKLILVVFSLTVPQLKAQTIEVAPQLNYIFGGRINTQFGELNIQNSESYGLAVNIVNEKVSFQIEYFYQPTRGNYRDYFDSNRNQNSDLRISWFHIGARQRVEINEKIVPFAGISLGLTNFVLDSSPVSYNELALSFGLQTGVNVNISERIGLKFHGRLLSPVQFNGFGFYAGLGVSGATASAGSYFVQADFGTGLIVRLF